MATDTTNKPAVGDTVTITAKVESNQGGDGGLTLKTIDNSWYFKVDRHTVQDVKVIKKATPPAPPPGSVIQLKTPTMGTYKYIVKANGALSEIQKGTGIVKDSFYDWSNLDHGYWTVTVLA